MAVFEQRWVEPVRKTGGAVHKHPSEQAVYGIAIHLTPAVGLQYALHQRHQGPSTLALSPPAQTGGMESARQARSRSSRENQRTTVPGQEQLTPFHLTALRLVRKKNIGDNTPRTRHGTVCGGQVTLVDPGDLCRTPTSPCTFSSPSKTE